MGIEPTQPAWKAGALPLSHTRIKNNLLKCGAGDGNRTHVAGLGSRCSTIELHPLVRFLLPDLCTVSAKSRYQAVSYGAEDEIRTRDIRLGKATLYH